MGRWTPLILMAGGVAILMGTLLGINFPMGNQQETASNNAPTTNNTPQGKTAKVLPANINVNSSSANRNRTNGSSTENRGTVTQDNFNAPTEQRGESSQEERNSNNNRTSVAQNNAPNDSSSSENTDTNENTSTTPDTTTREVQSTGSSGDTTQEKQPIRALW